MKPLSSIVEQRIREARALGYFDDLPGTGKPIRDLHRQRPPGWWARNFVRTERCRLQADELEDEIRAAMPKIWRMETEVAVTAGVAELNEQIAAYNKVTVLPPREPLDLASTLRIWRRFRSTEPA